MIEPVTGLFEIVWYTGKQESTIANLVYQAWLCRYPRPTIIAYTQWNELHGKAFKNKLIENEYDIKSKCESMEKPQVNLELERIHQVRAKLVRTFYLKITT